MINSCLLFILFYLIDIKYCIVNETLDKLICLSFILNKYSNFKSIILCLYILYLVGDFFLANFVSEIIVLRMCILYILIRDVSI